MLQWHNWTIAFNDVYSIDCWEGHVVCSDKTPITVADETLLEYSETMIGVTA